MKRLYHLFLIPAVLIISSCKKDEGWGKAYPIPQEVLDYFYFQPGSIWVFQNDKTNAIDTITVFKANKSMSNGFKGDKYEKANSEWLSTIDKYEYHYSMFTQGSAGCIKEGSKWPCYILTCTKLKTGDVFSESFSWFYPFKQGYGGDADHSSQTSTIVMDSFIDSLQLGTKIHYKVMVVKITNSLVANRKDTKFYWAKGVGIIKKENITDGENWNLIYYNTIKDI